MNLLFSSLLGRRNGAFRAVLIHFVKDDDDIGRVSGSNLSLQKSEVDEYISPSCIKLGSKLMEQDKSKKNDIRRVWVRYLWLSKEIEIWVFLLRISYSYRIGSILDGVSSVSSFGFQSFFP